MTQPSVADYMKIPGEKGYKGPGLMASLKRGAAVDRLGIMAPDRWNPKLQEGKPKAARPTFNQLLQGRFDEAGAPAPPAGDTAGLLVGALSGAGRLASRVIDPVQYSIDQALVGTKEAEAGKGRTGQLVPHVTKQVDRSFRRAGVKPSEVGKAVGEFLPQAAMSVDPIGAWDELKGGREAFLAGDYGSAALSVPLSMMSLAAGGEKKAGQGLIRAYHGSPHDFDRFDISKIGTGEGAQAYGHGLYFAENEKVAEDYRKVLGHRANAADDPASAAAFWVQMHGGDRDAAKRTFESIKDQNARLLDRAAKGLPLASGAEAHARSEIAKADAALAHIATGLEPPVGGKMYEVNINADPASLLDWDAPLSGQSEAVRNALASLGRQNPILDSFDPQRIVYEPEMYGNAAYNRIQVGAPQSAMREMEDVQAERAARGLRPGEWPQDLLDRYNAAESRWLNTKAAATHQLQQAGIPGIKYLDQGSRAAGEGSRNYVIFDDKLIDIARKYGIPAGGVGLAGALALSSDPAQAATGDGAEPFNFLPYGLGAAGAAGLAGILGTKKGRQLGKSLLMDEAGSVPVPQWGAPVKWSGLVAHNRPGETVEAAYNLTDPLVPRIATSPEGLYRAGKGEGVAVPTMADRTEAGKAVTGIRGKDLSEPVLLKGGQNFLRTHDPVGSAWAGAPTPMVTMNNGLLALEGRPAFLTPFNMQGSASDFTTMSSDLILNQLAGTTKKARQAFDREMRRFRPDWSGIADLDNLDAVREQLNASGKLRIHMADRMDTKPFQEMGLPSVGATRKAMSDPNLATVPADTFGYNVGLLTGGVNRNPVMPHDAPYRAQIGGNYFGSFDTPLPANIMYPEYFASKAGQRSGDIAAGLRSGFKYQPLNQQWVDQAQPFFEQQIDRFGPGWLQGSWLK